MKKRIFGITFGISMLALCVIGFTPKEAVGQTITIVEIEIDIEIGTRGCVCKAERCIDQNVISFRRHCGHRDSGPASGPAADLACSLLASASECNG